MSDPPVRDPVDDAYVEAEGLLDDGAARAARRARVLASVAAPETIPAAVPAAATAMAPAPRRRSGFHPGWAAAAAVAGLGVLAATFASRSVPPPPPPPTVVAPPEPPAAAAAEAARPPEPPPAETARVAPAPEGAARSRDAAASQAELPAHRAVPPPASKAADAPAVSAPTPPPLPLPPVPAPVAPPSTVARPPLGELSDEAAPRSAPRSAGRSEAFQAVAPTGADAAAKLRAAAAAGRTQEVAAWLDRGVPVDAADAGGDTALIQSVRGDHPATAALLRRRGADPERTNEAGESAGDLATRRGDPRLDEALHPPR